MNLFTIITLILNNNLQAVLKNVGANEKVAGIGFDATCSLVVLDDMWQPLTVDSYTGVYVYTLVLHSNN